MAEMTMRQRMLAVIKGEPHDRVPFVSYRGMAPWEEAWKLIGRNNLGVLAWTPACNSETPNCRREVEEVELDGKTARRTTLGCFPKPQASSLLSFGEPMSQMTMRQRTQRSCAGLTTSTRR